MTATAERPIETAQPRGLEAARGERSSSRLPPGWPLLALFGGIPLWWALGVFQIAFFVFAIPMLVHLLRHRRAVVPDGFGVWLLLIVWVLGGVFVLQVDAPGAVPGSSMGRYPVFLLRMGWYACATVTLLYVVNTVRSLRTDRISYAIGWMFVALVGGGLLAMVVPNLEFATPLELALPRSLASDGFIKAMVHAQVAQVQDFLGYVEPRPSAPFPYANQWGVGVVTTAPHFIAGWWAQGGPRRRLVPVVTALAIAPIVSSLNRGMWAALLVTLLYALIRSGLHRRPAMLGLVAGTLVVAATAIWMSPLGDLITDRLNTPHSNEGRSNLGTLTVQSALAGSPFIGFGTTREVQGTWNSIAAGASAACPACSPAPLGTQGNLWELIFGSGFVALGLYLLFMLSQLARYWRVKTPLAIAAQCTLIGVLVTSPVYNLVHPILVVVLAAVGVLVREGTAGSPPRRELTDLFRPLRRGLPIVLVLALAGAAVGAAGQAQRGTSTSATLRVLIPPTDLTGVASVRPLALDSEALLVTSESVLEDAARADGLDPRELGERISVSAQPNTRILVIRVSAATDDAASTQVAGLVDSYLDRRLEMASVARQTRRDALTSQLEFLGVATASARSGLGFGDVNDELLRTLNRLQSQSQTTSAELAALDGPLDVGTVLSEPLINRSVDPWIIWTASGLMLGLLSGLALAWLTDGRIRRLHSIRRTRWDLPVVDRLTISGGAVTRRAFERAAQVVGIYSPLAGVVSDISSPIARRLASQLDAAALQPSQRHGRRVLLIGCERTSARGLEDARRHAQEVGLEPVGLILVER